MIGWARLGAIAVFTLLVTTVTLIAAHDLWENREDHRSSDQTVLFNIVTSLSLLIGLLTLYAALILITAVGALLLVSMPLFHAVVARPVGAAQYVALIWLVASLAMVGGALGAGLEEDPTVREAAYGRAHDHVVGAVRLAAPRARRSSSRSARPPTGPHDRAVGQHVSQAVLDGHGRRQVVLTEKLDDCSRPAAPNTHFAVLTGQTDRAHAAARRAGAARGRPRVPAADLVASWRRLPRLRRLPSAGARPAVRRMRDNAIPNGG
jgi:hypothetical protein